MIDNEVEADLATPSAWKKCYIERSYLPDNVEIVEAERASEFSIHFRLTNLQTFSSHSISLLVFINGMPAAFQSYRISDMQGANAFEVLSQKDVGLGQNQTGSGNLEFGEPTLESSIELRVFRMDVPAGKSGAVKKKDTRKLRAGQMVTRNSQLGTGDHFVVDDDRACITQASFKDKLDQPYATLIWKYMDKDLLEDMLIAKRSADSPRFNILPKIEFLQLGSVSPTVLEELDGLAFRYLDHLKVDDLKAGELDGFTSIFNDDYLIPGPTSLQLQEFAALQLREGVHRRLNRIILFALLYLIENGLSNDPNGCAMAADFVVGTAATDSDVGLLETSRSAAYSLATRMDTDSTGLFAKTYRSLIQRLKPNPRARARAEEMGAKEIELLCRERWPNWDCQSAGYRHMIEIVMRKYRDEEHLMMMVQVVRALGEKARQLGSQNLNKRSREDDTMEDGRETKRREVDPGTKTEVDLEAKMSAEPESDVEPGSDFDEEEIDGEMALPIRLQPNNQ